MKVLFVGSELTPIAKVGGLGDVMGALPKALVKLGIEVGIVIPRYGFISKDGLKEIASNIEVPLAHALEKVSLFETKLPNSDITVYLVENEDYWTHGPEPYFEQTAFAGAKDEIQRFTFFSKAVFTLIANGHLTADILHANDWHTGALVTLLKDAKNPVKTIFTIHNLGNQGKWKAEEIDDWFFPPGEKKVFHTFGNEYNFLAEGIVNADWVTTVSPTYAQEILTSEYGAGLESILKTRTETLTGILNGIDYEFYDPEHDKRIPKCFTANNLEAKAVNKAEIERLFNLDESETTPLFGLVSRLTDQKGIDLIIASLADFLNTHDARFVFLGKGVPEYEQKLTELQKQFPKKIYVKNGFDEELGHKIYAASDFFLMPSRFEPSGLGQMIAMRYGSVPIVRKTGGLKDSVKHLETGIVFEEPTAPSFRAALEKAFQIFTNDHEAFLKIQLNGMKENFDFSASGEKYKELYKQLLSLPS